MAAEGGRGPIGADDFEVTGEVELFPQPGGWHYVIVPGWVTDDLSSLAERGLIPVRVAVGSTVWDTSLLPMGDGRHFIALNAQVRAANGIELGDTVTVRFRPRQRR